MSLKNIWLVTFFFLMSILAHGQEQEINNIGLALKSGSSKELSNFFNETIELKIEGENANYSRIQAEAIIKDFFSNYPPVDFEYIHQGSSPEGLKYLIGKYTYTGGSFRSYILIKKFGDKYLIDTFDLSKE